MVTTEEINIAIAKAKGRISTLAYNAVIKGADNASYEHGIISSLSACIKTLENQHDLTNNEIKKILNFMYGEGDLSNVPSTIFSSLSYSINAGNTFLKLLDTPSAYIADKIVSVSPDGTGLVFIDKSSVSGVSSLNNMVISGGNITRDVTDQLKFLVDTTIYLINSTIYSVADLSSVTLANGDATHPRVDAIILTTAGMSVVQGVPAESPASPTVSSDQLLLCYINVPAGATSVSGATAAIGRTIYVATNGNDATAQPGNINKPYSSIVTAMTIAAAYDTIKSFTGIYYIAQTITLKSNVNLVFENVVLGTFGATIFRDNGTTVNCRITGVADIFHSGTLAGAFRPFLVSTGAGSNIEIDGNFVITHTNIDNTLGQATFQLTGSGATYRIKGLRLTTTACRPMYVGSVGTACKLYMENCYVKAGANAQYNHAYNINAHYVNCIFVNNSLASGTGSFSLSTTSQLTVGTIIFNSCKWIDAGDWISITHFSTTCRPIFIGDNVIYGSGVAESIGAFGTVGCVLDIMGTIHVKNAQDTSGNITYRGTGTVEQDSFVYYEY